MTKSQASLSQASLVKTAVGQPSSPVLSFVAALAVAGVLAGPLTAVTAVAAPPDHAGEHRSEKGDKGDKGNQGDKGNKGDKGHSEKSGHEARDSRHWQNDELVIIRQFFNAFWQDGTSRSKPMPPGLAKKGKIPPGIAAQIQQGKRLPAGVGDPLPPGLRGKLPQRPGFDQVLVGSDVLLVDAVSRVIVDILRGVAG